VIEANFDLSRYNMQPFFDENDIEYDAGDCIIRRELTAAGKSRAFINDTPVALSMLKELGDQLMDVHSQHQNLLLNKQDFQLEVVDIIADDAIQLAKYQHTYAEYLKAEEELEEMTFAIERNRENLDFLQFQYEELSNANLTAGEQEELEQRSETMEHSEDIKSALYTTDNALSGEQSGVIESLRTSLSALRNIEAVYPEVSELIQRIDSSYIELKDVSHEISSLLESVDFDPAELDQVNSRLDRIYELEKKYHVDTVEDIIAKRDSIYKQLQAIEGGDESLDALKARKQQLEEQARKEAEVLTKLRTKAAKTIETEMQKRLVPLGMPHVRFSIQLTVVELGANGADRVSFLFSANTSTPLQPVSQVASGGEIARVMLSLKAMISGAVKLPTIIFDEIDTGVSGKTAEMMAQIMKEMGNHGRQVISITHLPQIAALGSVHYKVEKNETASGTTSKMRQLTDDERVREIAQMLSGSDVSEAAIQNAKALLGH
jgi:DNA repair protein RecN (Recombination protein N)